MSKYLKKKYIVICDRYIDSTYVYQHYEQGQSLKFINFLQKKIDNNVKPNITFFLDVKPSISKNRVYKRKKLDRFDKYNKTKMNNLRKSFLKLTKKYKRIIKIDGSKNKNEVHNDIIKYLTKKMSFKISDNIIGFEEELSFFLNLYTNRHLPNTILFQGLEGIGKYTFVLHLINLIKSSGNTTNLETALSNDNNVLILKKKEK